MEQVTLEPFDVERVYVSGVIRTLEIVEIDPSCLVSNKFWTSQDPHRPLLRNTSSHRITYNSSQPPLISVGQTYLSLSCENERKKLEKNIIKERQDPYLAKGEVDECQDLVNPCEKTLTIKSHEMSGVRSNETTLIKNTAAEQHSVNPRINSDVPNADILPVGLSTDTFLQSIHIFMSSTTTILVLAEGQSTRSIVPPSIVFPVPAVDVDVG
ncbi:hypothetical protein AgCh_023760 [Apium graveolens]